METINLPTNAVNENDLSNYLTDLFERNILFMDVMRRRGNDMVQMTTEESATVLTFKVEKILDGANFAAPINYWLARVLPYENSPTDLTMRPYVIQDPRAGRGPGIAGFKKDSEIGAALATGHPVYFVGFDAEPIGQQTFSDVIRGQVKFYRHVAELHPDSPKMCAIGNCAAGLLTMFSAIQAPDIFGPILVAGSPLSSWNGERGKNPMRYGGGKVGGSWLISLLGDLGGGRFDGTHLVMNFNILNFDNFIWGKQYDLFANIDKDGERYLQFEKWLSSFGKFNREEILWIVDNIFIANRFTTGQLETEDGISLDPRLITSPIITFISDGDNISPPAQSAGWIADLYEDVDEIIARGKTIVYCLNQKVGHLALFTGSKVAKRESQLFVENMDTIDLLPPGLFELILDTPEGKEGNGDLEARYVVRQIEDIKKLGYNSVEDDRAFATLAKASHAFTHSYNDYIHPWFKIYSNPMVAEYNKLLQPLRWSYWLFAEKYNPFIKVFEELANQVKANRHLINPENKYLSMQKDTAQSISDYLHDLQDMRDKIQEHQFFATWGNEYIQKFWDTFEKVPRYIPSLTKLEREKLLNSLKEKVTKLMPVHDMPSAVFRLVIILFGMRSELTESHLREIRVSTMELLVKWAKDNYPDLTDDDLREIIANQLITNRYNHEQSLAALCKYGLKDKKTMEVLLNTRSILAQLENVKPETLHAMDMLANKLIANKG